MKPTSKEIDAAALVRRSGARLRAKSESPLMKVLGVLLRAIGNRRFMQEYWTTLGATIYYPSSVVEPYAHWLILEHELVHVRQWRDWGILFSISYVLLPLPIGLAWFRWRWEREAYLVQLRAAHDPHSTADAIARRLFADYGWPWPRPWMRRWFENQIAQLDREH